jgi:hypothetical protein
LQELSFLVGDNVRSITVDLSKGTLSEGSAQTANVVFTMDSNCFVDMLEGRLKASNAFMSQQLKVIIVFGKNYSNPKFQIKGDITLALKLEKALNKLHKKK